MRDAKDLENVLDAIMTVATDPTLYTADDDKSIARMIDAAGMMQLIGQVCTASSGTIRQLVGDQMGDCETIITEAGTQVRTTPRGDRELVRTAVLHADARENPALMKWLMANDYIDNSEIRKSQRRDPRKNVTLDVYDI